MHLQAHVARALCFASDMRHSLATDYVRPVLRCDARAVAAGPLPLGASAPSSLPRHKVGPRMSRSSVRVDASLRLGGGPLGVGIASSAGWPSWCVNIDLLRFCCSPSQTTRESTLFGLPEARWYLAAVRPPQDSAGNLRAGSLAVPLRVGLLRLFVTHRLHAVARWSSRPMTGRLPAVCSCVRSLSLRVQLGGQSRCFWGAPQRALLSCVHTCANPLRVGCMPGPVPSCSTSGRHRRGYCFGGRNIRAG